MNNNDYNNYPPKEFENYKNWYLENFGYAHNWFIQFSHALYLASIDSDDEYYKKIKDIIFLNIELFNSGRLN